MQGQNSAENERDHYALRYMTVNKHLHPSCLITVFRLMVDKLHVALYEGLE
jgi:hypothetical protein